MLLYESGEYRATKNWPYCIAAGGVVYRMRAGAYEVLLLLRKAGQFPHLIDGDIDSYHLPKGHMALTETVQATALREIQEEAGCEVELTTYLGATLHQYVDQDVLRDKIIHYFAALWQYDLDEMDDEHSDRVWCSLDEAIQKIGSKNPKHEDKIIHRLRTFLNTTPK